MDAFKDRTTMRACLLFCALLCFSPAVAAGQEPPADGQAVPAAFILRFRTELELTDAQAAKLQALAQAQSVALSRATAAYLRAEADLLDATRGQDLGLRKTALEKRARIGIDAEIERLKAEKDSRAILTAEQNTKLAAAPAVQPDGKPERVSLWQPIVMPAPLTMIPSDVRDSAEVRVSVVPNHADIYIDGTKVGTGRKFITLPVGTHLVRFTAIGCTAVDVPVAVVKGPPIPVPQQTLICGQ